MTVKYTPSESVGIGKVVSLSMSLTVGGGNTLSGVLPAEPTDC